MCIRDRSKKYNISHTMVDVKEAYISSSDIEIGEVLIKNIDGEDKDVTINMHDSLVFVRAGAIKNLTSQALVSSLQTIGFFLINDLEAMLLCDNKMASTVALERNNIPVPRTSIINNIKSKNGHFIFGISNRLEQVIANLLDNSISFSKDNQKIEIGLEETSSNLLISVKDEGPGFAETSPQKIFKRFYSNRPASFGKHSGLGLNIVKNIVQLHKGTVAASNRLNAKGAQVEVLLPKVS